MEQLVNYQGWSLISGITAGTTSFTVNPVPTGLTANGTFSLLVEQEVMEVTGVSGSTLTVNRGMEGSTAVSHNAGVAAVPIISSRTLLQLKLDQVGLGTMQPIAHYSTAFYAQASDITTFATNQQITAATNASPIVLSCPGTTLVTGNKVFVSNGTGNTGMNGLWDTIVSGNQVTLVGSVGNGVYPGTGATLFSGQMTLATVYTGIYNNVALLFSTLGGRLELEELQFMNQVLVARGLPPVTSCVLPDTGTQLALNWPNTLSVYGPHFEWMGPGTANVVQLLSPNNGNTTRISFSAFHGTFYSRGIVLRGDPNAPSTGFFGTQNDANIVLALASFWRTDVDMEIFGCCGTTAVFQSNGITGANKVTLRQASCGVAPTTSTRPVAIGVAQLPGLGEDGSEFTLIHQAGQLPQFTVPNKAYGLGPSLYIGEGEAAGVNTGNATIFRNCTFADSASVAVYIAPQAANTVSGAIKFERAYFAANCASNAATEGGAMVISNCSGLKLDHCTANYNSLASAPLLAFGVPYQTNVGGTGGSTTVMGPVDVEENQTPMYASTTVLPVTVSGGTRPSTMTEKFDGLETVYNVIAAGQTATVNFLAVVAGNDNSSYAFNGSTTNPNPTMQTAPTSTAAQLVPGVFQASGAAGAYVPWAHLNQRKPLAVVNDTNAAIAASTGASPVQVAPSSSVAGKVRAAASVTNGIGIPSTAIPTTGSATGFILPRAA